MSLIILSSSFSGISIHAITLSSVISLTASVALLICSIIISASEVAFFSLPPQTISELENSNAKSEQHILKLLQTPQRLLATILISNNFVNVGVILLLTHFTSTILNFDAAPFIGFLFQAVFITFVLLLFGEIIPKVYATQFSKRTAIYTAPILLFLEKVLSPVVSLLVNSTSIVNKKLIKKNQSNISMDELSHALELTSNAKDEDTEILEGIIKFGNIQVVDIMTSRVDIIDAEIKTNYTNILSLIIKSGYSRIPIYSDSRDNIRGILYSKDLLPHLDKPANFKWQNLIRQAYFVPETKMIDDLLNEFQEKKIHLALVADEYGGITGLVTMEDILEEIVGDISDEYDDEEKLYTKIDDHTFVFEAKILLNDFFKIDEINPVDFVKETDDVETLAGLILEIKGDFPEKDEQIEFGRYIFKVIASDNRRIKKVSLYIKADIEEKNEI